MRRAVITCNLCGGINISFDEVKQIILDYIHEETGFANPLHPHYEIEELTILELRTERDGTQYVSFEYMFNEDGFSKNDKTHILVGNVVISPTGKILNTQLKETHRGVAATRVYEHKPANPENL
ncbi:MAG: hypothetical protein FK733_04340 [Asgard group archaeon]|nr:hypothetical protein [Asgard group archaeon]